ncbi:DUF4214 domain-containing protein [Maritalea porphyrae]|uniref:DUF4214 domain-containing protein n=1 Tax=Maritalea porphyrae TaxID=880732 RepID=UPI0022AF545F|nr:DUF4214 domain-containing protein [Maritalea porphyrae]MCZ4274179.1 DUF4214 domain-containing protein [Maritalea porphyrae]
MLTNYQIITRLYIGYFNRAPDPNGIKYWVDRAESGMSFAEIAQSFSVQAESTSLYPYFAEQTTNTPDEFLVAVYANLFHRTPDAEGLNYWMGKLAEGTKVGQMIIDIISGALGDDAELLSNKLEVAEYWTSQANDISGFVFGEGAKLASKNALSEIGSDAATIELSKAAADEFFLQKGVVIDGKIAGATVGVDVDGDGVIGVNEPTVTTDDLGNFEFPFGTATGKLIAFGGVDIATNLPFVGQMEAPAGSKVVTPLTTLISKLADADASTSKTLEQKVIDAQAVLKNVFGFADIKVDLAQTDIVKESTEGDSEPAADNLSDMQATQLYALAAKVAVYVRLGTAVIVGADDAIGSETASNALYEGLAHQLNLLGPNGVLDLDASSAGEDNSSDLMVNLLEDVSAKLLSVESQAHVNSIAKSISVLSAAASKEISTATANLASGSSSKDTKNALVDIAKVQKATLGKIADDLTLALKSDDPSAAVQKISNAVLLEDGKGINADLIKSQDVGDVDADSIDDDIVDESGSDNGGGTSTPTNDAPTAVALSNVVSLAEDANTASRVKVADIVVTDDGLGTNVFALTGADAAKFEIDGVELYLKAGTALDFETDPSFSVGVSVDDVSVGATPDATSALATVQVTNANEAPTAVALSNVVSLAEDTNTASRVKVADIVVSDDEIGTNVLALTGADAANFEIDGVELFLKAGTALDFETSPSFSVGVSVDDVSIGATPDATSALATVQITNVNDAPTITGDLSATVDEGSTVALTGADLGFTDQDDNADNVVFTVSNLSNGLIKVGGIAQTSFTGTQLANNTVSFQHDGSNTLAAGFNVVVEDGDEDGSVPVSSAFSLVVNPIFEPIELSTIESGTGPGFVINGVDVSDLSGYSVSSAGDVNGDGFDDLLIGAYGADPSDVMSAGSSYVVFGKADQMAVELSSIEAGTGPGFVINGVDASDISGNSVSSAGDVNGDGFDDLFIGAQYADPSGVVDSGSSYVVFGKADQLAVELSTIEAGTGLGFVINGVDIGDISGFSVSSAGDVNGDGLDDLIIGAYRADLSGGSDTGSSYVVFGKADQTAVELSSIEAGTGPGFVINGVDIDDNSGRSVSLAGDVNGDGFDDLIIGAYNADPSGASNAGASYVVFGKADQVAVELSNFESGTGPGFVINGVDVGDFSGFSVSSAGDVNGDGFDDLIIGAYNAGPQGATAGSSYVVFGGEEAGASIATLVGTDGNNTLNGTGGADRIIAGQGDDTIIGGAGNDYLVGAKDNDTFVFANGSGNDTIRDFKDGADIIDISDFGFADITALKAASTDQGGNVVIQLDVDDSVKLIGLNKVDLEAADFTF